MREFILNRGIQRFLFTLKSLKNVPFNGVVKKIHGTFKGCVIHIN